MSVTCVLSGPLAGRGRLLARLERAGLDISEQPERNPSHGLPADPSEGWLDVIGPELAAVMSEVSEKRWRLRLHWNTPDCVICGGRDLQPPCPHCGGKQKTNVRPRPFNAQEEIERLSRELAELRAGR